MIQCAIFGGLILDRYLELPEYPKRGQDILITRDFEIAGGCSINMAVTFRNLGGEAHVVSQIGNDSTGQGIRQYLEQNDLSMRYVQKIDGESGYCLVLLEEGGERTFLTKKGVECLFDPVMLPADLDQMNHIMVTGYYLIGESGPAVVKYLTGISSRGLLLFDPGPLVSEIEPEILLGVLDLADVITVNEVEAAQIEAILSKANQSATLIYSEKILVVKRGSLGGRVKRGAEQFEYKAKPVDVVDTTGAGDSFAAGLMYGLLSGQDLKNSVALAAECAARTVSIKGPHGFWKPGDTAMNKVVTEKEKAK